MKTLTLRYQFSFLTTNLTNPKPNSSFLTPQKNQFSLRTKPTTTFSRQALVSPTKDPIITHKPTGQNQPKQQIDQECPKGHSRMVILGVASVGVVLFLMGIDHHNKALALGPEGPLVEEFWDNVRRYAIYALTVSTGALYTILQPIVELLKNPISALLIILILGGGFYVVSQILYAMVGVTDFNYDYGY